MLASPTPRAALTPNPATRAEAKYYPHKNTRTRLIDLVGRGFEYKNSFVRSTTSRIAAWEKASTSEGTLRVVSFAQLAAPLGHSPSASVFVFMNDSQRFCFAERICLPF
jgi:hypothetical protein